MAEVGIAQLRQELKEWLARAQGGDEVVITDRGEPVARLTGIDTSGALERLVAEGRVSRPRRPRPHARDANRIRGVGNVSEAIVVERETRRG